MFVLKSCFEINLTWQLKYESQIPRSTQWLECTQVFSFEHFKINIVLLQTCVGERLNYIPPNKMMVNSKSSKIIINGSVIKYFQSGATNVVLFFFQTQHRFLHKKHNYHSIMYANSLKYLFSIIIYWEQEGNFKFLTTLPYQFLLLTHSMTSNTKLFAIMSKFSQFLQAYLYNQIYKKV